MATTLSVGRRRPEPEERRLMDALRAAEYAGLRLATHGRFASLAVVAVLLLYIVPWPHVVFHQALLVGFVAIGYANYWSSGRGFNPPWLHPTVASLRVHLA